MAKHNKMYKSLGMKRTWALSVGAATILGGLGTATVITRYFGSSSIATNAQIDAFWETVENNSASFFHVSEFNNKEGEATFQFQESTFLNFIERNHIQDDFVIVLDQVISYENADGETIEEKFTYEFTRDNLNDLANTGLYAQDKIQFKLKIKDGEWKEITSPFDRQNFEHPTGLRAPKQFAITGIVENDAVYARINYPNELFASIDVMVDKENPTEDEMMAIGAIVLKEPENKIFDQNTFQTIEGVLDQGVMVDVRFKKATDGSTGHEFTQENIDRYFVPGDEYILTVSQLEGATSFWDSRLELHDNREYYKEFRFMADPTDWRFNWNTSAVKDALNETLDIILLQDGVMDGYFDEITIDLDKVKEQLKHTLMTDVINASGIHDYDWITLDTLIEMDEINGQIVQGTQVTFSITDNANLFNSTELVLSSTRIPDKSGAERTVADTALEIYELIQKAFDQYAAAINGISKYFTGDLKSYNNDVTSGYNFHFGESTFTDVENGTRITFVLTANNNYLFDGTIHDSANTTPNGDTLTVGIDVSGLLEPIASYDQWSGFLDVQDSYGGFEAGNVELLDQAITDTNTQIASHNYSISKVPGFDYKTLSLGDEVPIQLMADLGYTFSNTNTVRPILELTGEYIITYFDYDENKTIINLVDNELNDLVELLVQDLNNWSGDYSGEMSFTIPDEITGKNYTIEMHGGNQNWTRTLHNVSNEANISFRITEKHGYIFHATSVTTANIKVDDLISHDENIDITWDTDLAWTYLSGAPNSRVDLTMDLDGIARSVFGDRVVVTMDIANGTIAADNDLVTFTITAKDGYYLSSQAIYASVNLNDFVEAPKTQIGAIDQAIWEKLINSSFYTIYKVSGATALDFILANISDLEQEGIGSISIEHFDKDGHISNRVHNGQTIKIHLEPTRDFEFGNPDDANHTFVVSGLKYYLDSPQNLAGEIESQYNRSILASAVLDEDHRKDGSYEISVADLLIIDYASIDGLSTIEINGSTSYDAISSGRATVKIIIHSDNDYFFDIDGTEMKEFSINITINELAIKDEWKTVIDINQAMYDDLVNELTSRISGVNGLAHFDYVGAMSELNQNYPDITFTVYRNGQEIKSDLTDVNNLDVIRLRMEVGEWFKLTNDTSMPVTPDGTSYSLSIYPSLLNAVYQDTIETAINVLYGEINAYHLSGFPVSGDMEYNVAAMQNRILSVNQLSTLIEIQSLIFKDKDGVVVTNGNLSNGFTIEVVFTALAGNAIVDSSNNEVSNITLSTGSVNNDSKISISTIDFASEVNKLMTVLDVISETEIDFKIEYDGTVIESGDSFEVELLPGVVATIVFTPSGGVFVGDWTNFTLKLGNTNFTGDDSWGYEWTGSTTAGIASFNASQIGAYDDIYDHYLVQPSVYSEISNANENTLIYDLTNAQTGEGYIDPTTLSSYLTALGSKARMEFAKGVADGSGSGFTDFDPDTYAGIANNDRIRIKVLPEAGYYLLSGRTPEGTFAVMEETIAAFVEVQSMAGELPAPEVDTSTSIPTIEGFEVVPYYSADGKVGYSYKGAGNEEFWKMFEVKVSGGTNKMFGNGEEVTVTIYYKSLGGIMYEELKKSSFTFNAIVTAADTSNAASGLFDGDTFNDSNGDIVTYSYALDAVIQNMQQVGYEKNKVTSYVPLTFNQSWSPQYGYFGPSGSKLEAFAEKGLISYNYTSAILDQWKNFYVDMEIYTSLDTDEVEQEYRNTFGADRSFKNEILYLGVVGAENRQTHDNVNKALDALWFAQEIIYDILFENNFDASAHHLTRESPYGDMAQMDDTSSSFIKVGMADEYNDILANTDPFLSSLFTNDVSGTGTIFDGMNVGTFLTEFFSNYDSWFTDAEVRNMRISNEIAGQSIIGNRASNDPAAMSDFILDHSFYLTKEVEAIFGLMFGWNGVSDNTRASAFRPYYFEDITTTSDWSTKIIDELNSQNWQLSSMHRGMSIPLYYSKAQYNSLNTDIFEAWKYMTNGPFGSSLQNDETIDSGSYGKALLEYMKNINTDNIESQTSFEDKVYAMYDELMVLEVGQLFGNPINFISDGSTANNATNAWPNLKSGHYAGLMSIAFNTTNPRSHPIRSEGDITDWVNTFISDNSFYFNQVELKQLISDENRTSTTTTLVQSAYELVEANNIDGYTDITTDIYKRK